VSELARAWLHELLAAQLEALQVQHDRLQRHEPDAVHDMRVAARRLRSSLASYRPLLPKDATRVVRDDLKWVGQELSDARDTEVMLELLEDRLAGETDEEVLAAKDVVDGQLSQILRRAFADADDMLTSARYRTTIERTTDLVDGVRHGLRTGSADLDAETAARDAVHRAVKRLRRRIKQADGLDHSADDGIAALHEVRKAAKRARYSAEAAAPLLGEDATRLAVAAEHVQTLLGDHRDEVVLRDRLRDLAEERDDADTAYALGRLAEAAVGDAPRVVPGYPKARRKVCKRSRPFR
jgi:CHAD domain-containing protein